MLQVVPGFPPTVVAFKALGRVTRKDYEEVLVPCVSRALEHQRRIRCYYELGSEFSGMDAGAMWDDLKIGLGTLASWERVAVVTDVDWMRHALNALRFLMPGELRVFPTQRAGEARDWIVAA